jgi:hypothetical protein
MKNKLWICIATFTIVCTILACSPGSLFATATPMPTYTPLPTYTEVPTFTPVPTYTPVPTDTPMPTATLMPQIPGIDVPVSVQGVTMQFLSVTITNGPVTVGDTKMTPNPGRSVLVIHLSYTGDITTLFNGAYNGTNVFYITDVNDTAKDWQHLAWGSSTADVGFFVMTGEGPYILHNTVDTPWTVDLTSLIQ